MSFVRPDSFRSIPHASGGIIRLAYAALREKGKDAASVLAKAGVTVAEIEDPTARVDAGRQVRFLNLAAEEVHDELFGFHLARKFELREIGLVYYVTASSKNFSDAFANAARYSSINNEGVRLRFRTDRNPTIAIDYERLDRQTDRHHMEFWLVVLVRVCRQITNGRIAPRQVRARHFRKTVPEEMKKFFGGKVEFGAETDEIVFPSQVTSLALVGRDPYLNELLRRYADEALASRPAARAGVRAQVQTLMPELLPHGSATASEIALRLGMSPRTLSRKLSEEGTSFAEMLDEFREALARRYLDDPGMRVTEIAWLLGYRQVSAFSSAFKKWTGVSPREFR
jgi:AraC-like DNA-binding protein